MIHGVVSNRAETSRVFVSFFFVVGIATSQTLPYLLSSLSRSLFIYIKNFYQERDFFLYYLIVEKIDLIIRKKEKYELFKITSNLNLAIFLLKAN